MAQKKIPARQCIGCMTSRPKKELVRGGRAPRSAPQAAVGTRHG